MSKVDLSYLQPCKVGDAVDHTRMGVGHLGPPNEQGLGAGGADSVWAWGHGSVDGLRPWGLVRGSRALVQDRLPLVCA